jgi:hypothetical protein
VAAIHRRVVQASLDDRRLARHPTRQIPGGSCTRVSAKNFSDFCRCQHASYPNEPALSIWQRDHDDLATLLRQGWCVRDPFLYAGTTESYREFIQYSRAEFSVAKHGYVKSRSGWFSDRTACYLASGKPAVVQSTALEWCLPTGVGLQTFSTVAEACEALDTLHQHYDEHCTAARAIAEAHLDSAIVLPALLNRVGI